MPYGHYTVDGWWVDYYPLENDYDPYEVIAGNHGRRSRRAARMDAMKGRAARVHSAQALDTIIQKMEAKVSYN